MVLGCLDHVPNLALKRSQIAQHHATLVSDARLQIKRRVGIIALALAHEGEVLSQVVGAIRLQVLDVAGRGCGQRCHARTSSSLQGTPGTFGLLELGSRPHCQCRSRARCIWVSVGGLLLRVRQSILVRGIRHWLGVQCPHGRRLCLHVEKAVRWQTIGLLRIDSDGLLQAQRRAWRSLEDNVEEVGG